MRSTSQIAMIHREHEVYLSGIAMIHGEHEVYLSGIHDSRGT
jgi:hypothetical protein